MSPSLTIDPDALPIRAGLAQECERAWQRLASAGTWWSGVERLAIAAETRNARACKLCRRRKEALSPYGVEGSHDALGGLADTTLEVVHRIATDAGRLTRKWLDSMLGADLTEERYVEAVGVIALITALDTLDLSLGRAQRQLPAPRPGAPDRRRPAGAKKGLAWVSTLAPADLAPGDIDPYAVHGMKNIHQALSLVPQEVLNFFDLDVELYMKDFEIRDFTREYRALTHAQIELLAGRVSALNGCYY